MDKCKFIGLEKCFARKCHYTNPTIETQASEIRRSSFDILHKVYKGEALAIEARETRVWAGKDPDNAERIKGYPIPAEVVAALKATA